MTTSACFVVLEGGDATGKSTQVAILATRLRQHGLEVEATFEPGATQLGERLRPLLLDGEVELDPIAEALLMAADRAEHVAEVVRPALARGSWVVSDRFVPSSLAYQGVGRGLGVVEVDVINSMAVAGIEPDLVVVLDLSPEVARERLGEQRDRLEDEGDAFALAVHEAYRDLAKSRGWAVVDASASQEAVADAVWDIVHEELLGE
jgi:dTMP kinase